MKMLPLRKKGGNLSHGVKLEILWHSSEDAPLDSIENTGSQRMWRVAQSTIQNLGYVAIGVEARVPGVFCYRQTSLASAPGD